MIQCRGVQNRLVHKHYESSIKAFQGVGSGLQTYVWERSGFHTTFRRQPQNSYLAPEHVATGSEKHVKWHFN